MPPSQAVRRAHFADWVRRVIGDAEARGLSVPKVAELAGISNSTIYRWANNTGAKMPSPDQLVAFCDALDLDPTVPFKILWPGKHHQQVPTPPAQLPPEVQAIARKLQDPNLPPNEAYHLLETLRQLAARPTAPAAARVVSRRKRA